MNIRPETPVDIAAIVELTRQAFYHDGGGRPQNEILAGIRASGRFVPNLSLVAEMGGQIIGHVIVAPADLCGDDQNTARPRRVLYLGPISVLPAFQRQGIGSRLMRAVLARCVGRPEAMVVLWGHSDYYPRFGFRPAPAFGLLPDTPAAMVYPLQDDLTAYRGLELPA